MFGHDKQQDGEEDTSVPVSIVPTVADDGTTPASDSHDGELSLPAPDVESNEVMDMGAPAYVETPDVPTSAEFTHQEPVADEELSSPAITINSSGAMKDLGALRQEALHELSPLIGHLDQTPDEKYATAKMVYDETKDQALLTSVYEAAKNLSDDKAKAEAIWEVIQKINEPSKN